MNRISIFLVGVITLGSVARATEFAPTGQQRLRIERHDDVIQFERCKGSVCIGLGRQDGTFTHEEVQNFISRAAANDPMVAPIWMAIDRWLFKIAIPCATLLGVSHLAAVVHHPLPFWPQGLGYVLAVPVVGTIFAKPIMDGERKTVQDQAAVLETALSERFEMDAASFDVFVSNLDVVLRRIASFTKPKLRIGFRRLKLRKEI